MSEIELADLILLCPLRPKSQDQPSRWPGSASNGETDKFSFFQLFINNCTRRYGYFHSHIARVYDKLFHTIFVIKCNLMTNDA